MRMRGGRCMHLRWQTACGMGGCNKDGDERKLPVWVNDSYRPDKLLFSVVRCSVVQLTPP